MTERQKRIGLKIWHRWLGAVAALFIISGAVTGFLLQHPEWMATDDAPPVSLAADPGHPDRFLRGIRWGVEESLDGGATWRELPMLAPPEDVHRIHFAPGQRVFALGPQSLVTSGNGGRVWSEIRIPAELLPPGGSLLDVTTTPDGAWLILTDTGLVATSDEGVTWAAVGPRRDVAGRDMAQWVHDIHTGYVFGSLGRRVAELSALVVVFLTLSGLAMMTWRNGRRSR